MWKVRRGKRVSSRRWGCLGHGQPIVGGLRGAELSEKGGREPTNSHEIGRLDPARTVATGDSRALGQRVRLDAAVGREEEDRALG
jgi:hypothetical protein